MTGKERPIIVCGAARSGTTALSIMLNQHAEIGIAREIALPKLPSIVPLLQETAIYHRTSWTEQRRAEVVKAIWFFVGRPVHPGKLQARRWGMKTPWSEFDADLWNPLVKPLWVYVLRRGDRVFQSHIRLGWSAAEDPERLIGSYKESVRLGEAMRKRGSAHICQLDLAVDLPSRRRLAQGLFDFLEENVDSGVMNFVEKWPTRLRPTHPTNDDGPAGPVELPGKWRELLEADTEYQEMMLAHGY